MLGFVVLARRKSIYRLATSQRQYKNVVTAALDTLKADLAPLTCHRAGSQRYTTFGTQGVGHRRISEHIDRRLPNARATLDHHSPARQTQKHTSSHPASSTIAMDPSFNLDRRTLETGFSQPTRMDIQSALSGPCPSPSTDHSTPFPGRPKIKITAFQTALSPLAVTSSPTSLRQALDKPLSHAVIPQKARQQTCDRGSVLRGIIEDPFPGPPKIQKSIPPSFSLPALETSPRNHKRGTARGIGVDTRPVSRSSENRKIHRAILKTHSRASSFGKAARLNEGYGNGLGDNETSQG
ncbi:hypothetical protein D9611_011387 [Ephemerocybe angulata]|uniref:Uncharacterized protein n=1 Tax=Ephemerocybe angulata TaxID=980116 RepID=A0A8H5BBM1_9AGAR|nr:hypothetical protein D9611_011387 [Tulosesus angulatus]